MPEFPMKNFGGDCICKVCVVFCVYITYVVLLAFNVDANSISPTRNFYSAHSFGESIDHILRRSGNSNIFVSIIQPISIYVICVLFAVWFEPQYLSVHQDVSYCTIYNCSANCIPFIAILILSAISVKCRPFELCEIEISVRRYESNLPLRQGDFTVSWSRGCHSLSSQRLGFAGTTNPDTLILSEAEPRFAMEGESQK